MLCGVRFPVPVRSRRRCAASIAGCRCSLSGLAMRCTCFVPSVGRRFRFPSISPLPTRRWKNSSVPSIATGCKPARPSRRAEKTWFPPLHTSGDLEVFGLQGGDTMKEYRDHYFLKAKQENYPARSVYKLKEIDGRFKIFRKGMKVLDLGAAPGSWSLGAAERVGAQGKVLACDIQSTVTVFPPNVEYS